MDQKKMSTVLPNGIKLTFIPAVKFKTISLALFIHQELAAEKATFTALLPSVLERGSRSYPDNLTLRRELERLYGSSLTNDLHKKGERHLISCSLEMMHGKYVARAIDAAPAFRSSVGLSATPGGERRFQRRIRCSGKSSWRKRLRA